MKKGKKNDVGVRKRKEQCIRKMVKWICLILFAMRNFGAVCSER